jgi:hypothetical protein
MLAGVKGDTGPRGPAGDAPVALPLEGWTNLPLASGVTAIAGETPQYKKDPLGKVMLRGMAACTAVPQTIGTLPVGYRPSRSFERFWTSTDNGSALVSGYVHVDSNGVVTHQNGYANHSLAGVIFDTDTVTTVLGGAQGPQGPAGSLNAPNWDSGWYYESNAAQHSTTWTHNLNLKKPPSNVEWWFAPTVAAQADGPWYLLNLPNMKVTPAQTAADPYSNPGSAAFNPNTIYYVIYNAAALYAHYVGSWVTYSTGYYRALLWT